MRFKKYKTVKVVEREIEPETVRILEGVHITGLKCAACCGTCKPQSRMAVAWAEGRMWRLCENCAHGLENKGEWTFDE